MKVRELIALLKQLPQEAEVTAWDADAEAYMPVSGAVHGDTPATNVELQTDDRD